MLSQSVHASRAQSASLSWQWTHSFIPLIWGSKAMGVMCSTPILLQDEDRKIFFFFLIVFGGTEVPIILHFPLLPLRGQPTVKCHPRWQPISGLAVHCRLGRLLDSNPGLQFYNLVSLPMSHHCSLDRKTGRLTCRHKPQCSSLVCPSTTL
jgi:hypothetical protein